MAFVTAMWGVTLELAPWLLLGAVVAGLLHGLVPEGLIHRQLRGLSGVVKAVLFGVPLPLCSCGVIPAGLGLKRSGASDGAAVGFLIATPQTGVDSVMVAAGLLGWPFALYKVGAALLTGVVGGSLVELGAAPPEAGEAAPSGGDRSLRGMVDHAVDVVRMIWRWLLFGIVVSALLTVYVPPGSLAEVSEAGPLLALLGVLVASVPLYVCATASVPIAAALVHAGLPTGAALVFLMAGPATNVATLGAVHRGFGTRVVALYLGTLIVGSVGLGLAYEPLLGALTPELGHAHEHVTFWHIGASLLLWAGFAWFAGEELMGFWRSRKAATSQAAEVTFAVQGMTCNGCAARLERVLNAQDGVEVASVSFDDGSAVVKGLFERGAIVQAIEGAGFEAAQV